MTDPRDNKTYRTVEIEGRIWMAENLNYAGNEVGESSCYGNDDALCEIYGRLYTREAAMNSTTCGTYVMWANIQSIQHYFVINATTKRAFVLDYNSNIVYASIRCVKD